jgi:mannose-6-phosphate isomerase-like protein (cupin superfamily)
LPIATLSCSVGFAIAWVVLPSPAADPPAPDLKSQVLRWDDAKSHVADWGEMRRYFGGTTSATKDVLVAVAVVQPGKSVHKAHRHAEEEYLALIQGTGTWSLDGKEFPAQRGDILYVEPWVYHGLTNTGDKPLAFLVVRYNGKGVPPPAQPDDRPNELAGPTQPGQDQGPPPVKVTGVLTLNGQPLAGATITLVPEKDGRPAAGRTDAEGRYTLSTFANDDGAVPGRYRVTIGVPPDQRAPSKRTIPQRYANPGTSGLTVEVSPGPNQFQFDLQD